MAYPSSRLNAILRGEYSEV